MRGCHIGFPWINDVTNPCETLLMNHALPCQYHMDLRAHLLSKSLGNLPCLTEDGSWDPHANQPRKAQEDMWVPRIGQS
jgi:hypothetical protein